VAPDASSIALASLSSSDARIPFGRCASSFRPWVGRALALAAAVAVCLVSANVRAEQSFRAQIAWTGLEDVIRTGGAMLLLPQTRWRPETRDVLTGTAGTGAVVVPRATLLARDWGGTMLLMGHLSPTDQFRLSRSTRMIMGRVHIPVGRFMPFGQVGLGQWRLDPDIFPACVRDVESAGQVGGGLEVAVARAAVVALEADYTVLYREQHEPQMVDTAHHWASFVAARWVF
jgi:hypothetical protein